MFGRAVIRLGIDPHSSYVFFEWQSSVSQFFSAPPYTSNRFVFGSATHRRRVTVVSGYSEQLGVFTLRAYARRCAPHLSVNSPLAVTSAMAVSCLILFDSVHQYQ